MVYNRLTDADIDYMIQNNGRIGQAFNSFYRTDVFTSGTIDAMLKTITVSSYNKLDSKFQNAINRYISDNTVSNAGSWLTGIFGINMTVYSTMDELLADTSFWNTTVSFNESLRLVICLSVSSEEYMASHSSSRIYASFIETVAQSTDATMTFINALIGTSQLESFFANEEVCSSVVNKKQSMVAICYNLNAFEALITSSVGITCVQNSEIAQNVLVDALIVVADTREKMNAIHTSLDDISTNIESIKDGESVVETINATKNQISLCVNDIDNIVTNADILAENVSLLLSNADALKLLLYNGAAFRKIADSRANQDVASAVVSLQLISKTRSTFYGFGTTKEGHCVVYANQTQNGGGTYSNVIGYPEVTYSVNWAGAVMLYDFKQIGGNGGTSLLFDLYDFGLLDS